MNTQQLIDYKIAINKKLKDAKSILNGDVYNLLLLLSEVLDSAIEDKMSMQERIKELDALNKRVDDLTENGWNDQAGEEWKSCDN